MNDIKAFMTALTPQHILDFWYSEETRSKWFASTAEFDQLIHDLYETLWQEAAQGRLDHWMNNAEGSLALCIVLDQFPLNMFRGQVKSFQTEAKAITVSQNALAHHFQNKIPKEQRSFLYMPLMHSENLDDQNLAVSLFERDKLVANLRFAKHHRDLIKKFGRFPHRNQVLGRENTKNERQYLNSKEAFTG